MALIRHGSSFGDISTRFSVAVDIPDGLSREECTERVSSIGEALADRLCRRFGDAEFIVAPSDCCEDELDVVASQTARFETTSPLWDGWSGGDPGSTEVFCSVDPSDIAGEIDNVVSLHVRDYEDVA